MLKPTNSFLSVPVRFLSCCKVRLARYRYWFFPVFFLFALAACLSLVAGCAPKAAPVPQGPEVAVVTLQPERVVLTTELPGRTSPYRVA